MILTLKFMILAKEQPASQVDDEKSSASAVSQQGLEITSKLKLTKQLGMIIVYVEAVCVFGCLVSSSLW
jgi:hypothetical protein